MPFTRSGARDGREQWIVLHLEVQSQPDPDLPKRMFVYAARCFEKHGKEVFGYAILGDRSPSFRPGPMAGSSATPAWSIPTRSPS